MTAFPPLQFLSAISAISAKSSLSMARVLFQTLTLTRLSLSPSCKPPPLISVLTVRHRSNRSGKAQLIEINLESESGDVEVMGIRRLEDAIHRIIAQRLAPDWLPFIPGSSYWVPPSRRQFDLLKCMGKLAREMSVEDALAVTAVRGWPSPSYFIQDDASEQHSTAENDEAEAEAEIKAQNDSQNTDTKNTSLLIKKK
ncbi:hypothetical protein AAG906_020214 [Vitis piasezkii]